MTYLRARTGVKLLVGFVAMMVIFSAAQTATAQSTIFNIPSTDTVSAKKAYAEFDYLPQVPGPSAGGRFQILVPRVVVGVAPNLEAGANFSFVHVPGTTNSFFQPNIKYKFLHDDMKGLGGSAGLIWYTPMNNRTGVDSYGLVYGNFSKKVMGDHGPRITGGGYGIVGAEDTFYGPKGGAILGYEQPIQGKISFVADWLSGKNGFGYFTPGISITLPHSGLFNAGYSLGNDSYDGNKNRALFLYYGITLPGS